MVLRFQDQLSCHTSFLVTRTFDFMVGMLPYSSLLSQVAHSPSDHEIVSSKTHSKKTSFHLGYILVSSRVRRMCCCGDSRFFLFPILNRLNKSTSTPGSSNTRKCTPIFRKLPISKLIFITLDAHDNPKV